MNWHFPFPIKTEYHQMSFLQQAGLCTGFAWDNYDELTETFSGKNPLHDTVWNMLPK